VRHTADSWSFASQAPGSNRVPPHYECGALPDVLARREPSPPAASASAPVDACPAAARGGGVGRTIPRPRGGCPLARVTPTTRCTGRCAVSRGLPRSDAVAKRLPQLGTSLSTVERAFGRHTASSLPPYPAKVPPGVEPSHGVEPCYRRYKGRAVTGLPGGAGYFARPLLGHWLNCPRTGDRVRTGAACLEGRDATATSHPHGGGRDSQQVGFRGRIGCGLPLI
jgi:hypothetical protein